MIIRAIPHGLNLLPASEGRSAGVHISDLYGSLFQFLDPKRYATGGERPIVKMAMGLAWEQFLEKQLLASGAHAERPPEQLTSEGIAYSPDLVLVNGQDRVGEIKLTYMSDSEDLSDPKFQKWKCQAMAYCYHLGIPFARFYVLFVVGNYKDQRDPVLRAYDCEFTSRELRENWDMLVNHGRDKGLL